MTPDLFTAVDHYITDLFVPPDPALDEALEWFKLGPHARRRG
jgi:hypothetical protein